MMIWYKQALLFWAFGGCSIAAEPNMNGPNYRLSNSDEYDTQFSDPHFDVYSRPIRTLYSVVHWRSHSNLPLPPEIVKQFDNGTIMAVTGYEVDQVFMDERSVPITWAYNHHYMAWLVNSRTAQLVRKPVTKQASRMGLSHGADHYLDVELRNNNNTNEYELEYPQVQLFSEGNGGEMRQSWHGYPSQVAQLIQSPDTVQIIPMQIDTWNRQLMKNATFVPGGPLPHSSRIPQTAGYSGLIECPCSDRLVKQWSQTYALDNNNNKQCSGEKTMVRSAQECFTAAQKMVPAPHYQFHNNSATHNNTAKFNQCWLEWQPNGTVQVTWQPETESSSSSSVAPTTKTTVTRTVRDTSTVMGTALGLVNSTIVMNSDSTDQVELTLSGPSDTWFGVGFGTTSMCVHMEADECPDGGPYAIIVAGDHVTERKLDVHGPGVEISSSLTVVSNSVEEGVRTVRLQRAMEGTTTNHYSFDVEQPSLDVIVATGCGLPFSQHCDHGSSTMHFLPVNVPTQLCRAGIQATIGGQRFSNHRCAPQPTSDLLAQRNPTCFVQTYQGGLSCCRDGQSLLDVAQEIPWPEQYLEYRLKFRFYYQTYKPATSTSPASHQNAVRLYWQTEAFAGEYDVVQCRPGSPQSQCVHTITSRWQVRNFLRDCSLHDASTCTGKGSTDESQTAGIELVYAGPHCHAPSCLSMELYNADTGRLLCRVEPVYGRTNEPFDEKGFLAMPPCLFGSDNGLSESELLSLNTTLLSIKRNNSTLPHTGEMASWQMRGIVVPTRQQQQQQQSVDQDPTAENRPLLRQATGQ